ncbi:putative armadillo-like helical protein [Arabidopsis thaliana]
MEDDEATKQRGILEEEEENFTGRREESENEFPSHHPPPPPDELFDISTTVDPSYLISLIRKLLPIDSGSDERHNDHMITDNVVQGVVAISGNGVVETSNGDPESMDIGDNHDESTYEVGETVSSCPAPGMQDGSSAWEDHGCVLWDLAASRTHAELMVQNLILEVLHANLMVSKSPRIREICLGIIGNLACHEGLLKHIESTAGIVNTLVGQLFLDDTQCLSEVCRILTTGLSGAGCTSWAHCLESDDILRHILWIAENTLNPHLIEKSVGLLLGIIEGQPEVEQLLIPPLMNLGLTSLLINLLSFEMSKLTKERIPERYPVLEIILRAIEALSASDSYSKEICSSKELFQLVCDLMKLQDKAEVATSCVTTGVLIANMLSERVDFIPEVLEDFSFLEGLFSTLPFASDDVEARRALWNVIARLLARVNESEINTFLLSQYILVLLSNADIIEDDFLDTQLEDSNESQNSFPSQIKSSARTIAIQKIESILNNWNARKENLQEETVNGNCSINLADVKRLFDCCHRYIK